METFKKQVGTLAGYKTSRVKGGKFASKDEGKEKRKT